MTVFVIFQTIKTAVFVKIQTFGMCSVGGVDTATPVAAGHKQRARHVWGRVGRVMFIAVMLSWVSRPGRRGRRRRRGSRASVIRRG